MEKFYLTKNEFSKLPSIYIDKGTENNKYLISIDGIKYVINIFKNKNSDMIKNKVKKMEILKQIELSKNMILPESIVYIDNDLVGFTTKLIENSYSLSDLIFSSNKVKIDLLREAKKILLDLHSNNIIHSDISSDNFISDKNHVYLLDMLSCEFDIFKTYNPNIYYQRYIKKFGEINKYFDIYCFNMMTYTYMNKIFSPHGFCNILNENYGYFKTKESKIICQKLLLKEEEYESDFLIDKILKRDKLKLFSK